MTIEAPEVNYDKSQLNGLEHLFIKSDIELNYG